MRELRDSDLFVSEINKDNCLFGRVNKVLFSQDPSTVILNKMIFDDINKKIIQNKKEKIVNEMGNAILKGTMILFTTPPDKKIPDALPFVVFKQSGVRRVAANLCSIARPIKNSDGSITYEMGDVDKVFSIMYGAYLALEKFTSETFVTSNLLYDSAVLWAAMFNKPIYDSIGMNNQERNDAFMYFAIKFFVRYIMGYDNDGVSDSLTTKFLKGNKKNDLILFMEDKMNEKQINIYEGIIPFMRTLFNNEITQIRGVRVANITNSINVSFYLQKFVMTFGSNALLALCTYPYFIYVVIAAMSKSKMLKDKAFDRVFSTYTREVNHLLINISKID